jgi:ABC-2 type transport system permease protein
MSAAFPYPVVRPGDNPFTQPQSGGGLTALLQSLTFLGTLIAALPVIALAALGLFLDPAWHLAALIAGAGLGVAAVLGGIAWGARIFERRAPELLAFTVKHD